MDGIFSATLLDDRLDFHKPTDIAGYCRQFKGQEAVVTIELVSKHSEKKRMYAYFHKPILDATIMALTADGWVGVDKVIAEDYLKQNCARDIMYNEADDRTLPYSISKSAMNKARLLKFIVDCLYFLEQEHNTYVMDSQEYKALQKSAEADPTKLC